MKVAEFFIQLGIKGGEKAKEALSGIHGTLQAARNASWETKAGILGTVLAMEEMTRGAVNAAYALKGFAGDTGYSTDELQKWNYWAEMNNLSAETMTGTFKQLQMVQAQMELGQGANPAAVFFGLNQFQSKFEMISSIQKKLRAIGNDEAAIGRARHMANQLGLGDSFSALRTGTVGFGGMTKDMTLAKGEWEKLISVGQEWKKFWMTGTGIKNHIVSDFSGPLVEMVHTMSNAVSEVGNLSRALKESMKGWTPKELEAFKLSMAGVAVGIQLLLMPLGKYAVMIEGLVVLLDQINKFRNDQPNAFSDILGAKPTDKDLKNLSHVGKVGRGEGAYSKDDLKNLERDYKPYVEPKGTKPSININVKSHNNIHGANNPKETADQLAEKIAAAIYQDPYVNSLMNA